MKTKIFSLLFAIVASTTMSFGLKTYTVSEAIAAYDAGSLKDGDSCQVVGVISKWCPKSNSFYTYHSVSYYITDGINEFEFYCSYSLNKANFKTYDYTSEQVAICEDVNGISLLLGDTVIGAGQIKKYGEIYELNMNCYLKDLRRPKIVTGPCGESLTWTLNTQDSTLFITGMGAMNSWSSYTSVPWYQYHSYVKYINLPNGITSIGNYSFYDCCSPTSIEIPNSATSIGNYTFFNCTGLTSISIPNSVTNIGEFAFEGCSSLTTVTIPNSITSIGIGAFKNCSALASVTISNSVSSIESSVFSGCRGLTSITIPNNVTRIGFYAFYDCSSLKSVNIGNSVTYIGNYAFMNCTGLTSITIPNSVTSIGDYVFNDCSSLKSVNIGNSVTYIGNYAFTNCYRLTSITIPNSVTSIGDYVFNNCSGLKSVTIPNSVTNIGTWAFSGCTDLTSVEIPNSVTHIGNYAFMHCYSLTSISIHSNVTSIGEGAFGDCTGLTSLTIPTSVISIGSGAFGNVANIIYSGNATGSPWGARCVNGHVEGYLVYLDNTETTLLACPSSAKGEIIIPNSVTSIGNWAFYKCRGLTSITIPNSVISIGDYAFLFCRGLTSITIPNSVTSIGYDAFCEVPNIIYSGNATGSPWGARNVNGYVDGYFVYLDNTKTTLLACSSSAQGEIMIPNSVTNIENRAFDGCYALSSVTIPNSVISIGDRAFDGCSALSSMIIPNSVTSIGKNAFAGCSGLTSVKIEAEVPPTLGSNVFDNTNNCSIYVPCGTKEAYQTANNWSNYASIIQYRPLDYQLSAVFSEEGDVIIPSNVCDSMIITAIPNYGYHFTQWNDGITDNPRALILTQDTTFAAEFAPDKSGVCGDNNALTWSYEDNSKTLTINGVGALTSNYTFGIEAPTQMQNLIIGNDITAIGDSAFYAKNTLNHLTIGGNVTSIGDYAFAECKNFDDITCYATTVPTISDKTFYNIGNKQYIYLYVPEDRERAYKRDVNWGEFDIQIKGAEETTTDGGVAVVPTDNTVEITWPSVNNAETYEIVITKDGEIVCTLIFNSNGQLAGIAFAPGRNGSNHTQQAQTAGFKFTVTGLNSGTNYGYEIDSKNSNGVIIDAKSGTFTTTENGETLEGLESAEEATKIHKVITNGQILILRGEKVYTLQGQEVR